MSFGFRVRRWGGPVEGVGNARVTWRRRDGVLLGLFDDDRLAGLGEATPLPGVGGDDVGRAFEELSRLAAFEALPSDAADVFVRVREKRLSSASARFALETALLDAIARRQGVAFGALLGERRSLPRSVLVGALDGQTADRAAAAVERGASTLKLKLSGREPETESAELVALRRRLGRRVALRVDLNGALDLSAATRALEAYAAAEVELVEEPVSGRGLLELAAGAVPWLADESLVDSELADALSMTPACGGVVLKPTLLGLGRCLELGTRAKSAIVTHAFEGPVALAAQSELALALGGGGAAGLDRHPALVAFLPAELPQLPDRSRSGLRVVAADVTGLGLPLEARVWGF